MSRYQLANGNVICAEQSFIDANHPGATLLQDENAGNVKSWNAYDFAYKEFTQAERIAATTLAQTDFTASAFLHMLDNAIACGKTIMSNEQAVVDGLDYLTANPVGSPVLAAGRKQEILT